MNLDFSVKPKSLEARALINWGYFGWLRYQVFHSSRESEHRAGDCMMKQRKANKRKDREIRRIVIPSHYIYLLLTFGSDVCCDSWCHRNNLELLQVAAEDEHSGSWC